jgi:hypothetical protein
MPANEAISFRKKIFAEQRTGRRKLLQGLIGCVLALTLSACSNEPQPRPPEIINSRSVPTVVNNGVYEIAENRAAHPDALQVIGLDQVYLINQSQGLTHDDLARLQQRYASQKTAIGVFEPLPYSSKLSGFEQGENAGLVPNPDSYVVYDVEDYRPLVMVAAVKENKSLLSGEVTNIEVQNKSVESAVYSENGVETPIVLINQGGLGHEGNDAVLGRLIGVYDIDGYTPR